MLHLLLYGLLAILVAGGLFLIAVRFLPAGEQIAPPLRDEAPWDLPVERGLQPEDVDSVRLPVALRGYRFAETDVLLDRLAAELRARDEEIARLRGHHDNDSAAPVATGDFRRPAAPAPEPDPAPEADTAADPEAEVVTGAGEDTHADIRADAPDGRA